MSNQPNSIPPVFADSDKFDGSNWAAWSGTVLLTAQLRNAQGLTQATDTTNISLVFAAVKETILQNALKDSGIL
ncbi:hypothetical protein BD779DRAFT_1671327 [Infundibulicybe gibba]|nr:hypothetical protein BD779DRAFT_1671327 [Infundibulicybe gibba]